MRVSQFVRMVKKLKSLIFQDVSPFSFVKRVKRRIGLRIHVRNYLKCHYGVHIYALLLSAYLWHLVLEGYFSVVSLLQGVFTRSNDLIVTRFSHPEQVVCMQSL